MVKALTSNRSNFAFRFSAPANRSFSSSLQSLFQSESKCEIILMKMTLICMEMKLHAVCRTHFHMEGFALDSF